MGLIHGRRSDDKGLTVESTRSPRTGTRRGRRSAATSIGPSAREVRDWARSNGFKVPDRGRIPAEVREAFDKAN